MRRLSHPHICWTDNDGPRILGINPWITDFAAFNVWSRPVGLLACLDMLRNAGASVALLDCMDRTWEDVAWPTPGQYATGRYPKETLPLPPAMASMERRYSRYGLPHDHVRQALAALDPPPEAILVTSIMTYWYPGSLHMLDLAAELWPDVPRLLGGTYATLCADHARIHADADLIMQGSMEKRTNWDTLWNLLHRPAPPLPDNAGLGLALDLYNEPNYAPILGSRGCPFTCDYCASHALYPKFTQGEPDRIFASIASEYERGVRDFAFYDDALLVNPDQWLWPLLTRITEAGLDLRLHTPNAMHVRSLTRDVCHRLKQAGLHTVRLGLETTDFENRHDVKLTEQEWKDGANTLLEAGFDLDDIGVYILFGLPNQNPANVEDAIRHVQAFGFRPHLAHYTPIPGSPMFHEAVAASPYPLEQEPLFQNNSIWPCVPGGFNWEDARRWKSLLHGTG
ncbi:B12-binding domain-containing radical SAM protein [Pseudodesulfovibrio piezophilus]|uniref:Radical SAM domain protein n=1 Tax=Pseudodesulfovibrio piezophilus (strain DSM 21447 / JCM 15486 / C1TLV30) TaxID=1322246 RepID=M1WWY5_PSEP2|nr:B12-binding domain-containing radical SAM protein [Pseudodesulfovibrio piezophilus]CCH49383.1 Radical SAM domain protein [Pseudodesulfovibrio piezophilus C1TLV30]